MVTAQRVDGKAAKTKMISEGPCIKCKRFSYLETIDAAPLWGMRHPWLVSVCADCKKAFTSCDIEVYHGKKMGYKSSAQ